MNDKPQVSVDEVVVLSKYDGDTTTPESEVERLTIQNGEVVSHDIISNGEVVGPVTENNLTGTTGLGLFNN